jgi:GGDEF domain-containing protein
MLLESELERARRLNQPCALLMIDVDDFKGVNDLYGHPTGTEVLRRIAQTMTATVRGMDLVGRGRDPDQEPEPVVGRYGGDEFEIALPGTSRDGALKAARRIIAAVQSQCLVIGVNAIRPAISVGIAVYPDDALDAQELHIRADEALYESKRTGKGRAVLCRPRRKPQDPRTHPGALPSWLDES